MCEGARASGEYCTESFEGNAASLSRIDGAAQILYLSVCHCSSCFLLASLCVAKGTTLGSRDSFSQNKEGER